MKFDFFSFVASYVLVYTLGYVWAYSPHKETPWWCIIHWGSLAIIVGCMAAVIADILRPII